MASLLPRSGPLGRRLASHLLRRTTFRYTKVQIDTFAALTADQAVEQLLTIPTPTISEPVDYKTGQPWINSGVEPITGTGLLRDYVKSWWTHQALLDPSIGHKMMLFLHSNFVVAAVEGTAAEYFDYLALLRFYATGNFHTLATKITLDNQMLRYLDNTLNNKGNPNENYAREFLELFTIGKGPQAGPGNYTNYTEDDIIAAARLLSGIKTKADRLKIDPDTGLPMGRMSPSQHDIADKQFSAAFNNTIITGKTTAAGMQEELDDFVNMIFGQMATAKTISRKLYRFFVSSEIDPEIESDIIVPLAQTFFNSGYDLATTLRELLKSVHFYDEDDADSTNEIVGGLMRSPLELILHSLAYFEIPIPDPLTDPQEHYDRFYTKGLFRGFLPGAGMDLFKPSDVAGYPAYYQEPDFQKNWFNSSTIITRYQLPEMLIKGRRVLFNQRLGTEVDIVQYVNDNVSTPEDALTVAQELVRDLLPEAPDTDRFDFYLNGMFLDGIPDYDWTADWQAYGSSGDDSDVRPPLESFLTSLLYSQEFQAM